MENIRLSHKNLEIHENINIFYDHFQSEVFLSFSRATYTTERTSKQSKWIF